MELRDFDGGRRRRLIRCLNVDKRIAFTGERKQNQVF